MSSIEPDGAYEKTDGEPLRRNRDHIEVRRSSFVRAGETLRGEGTPRRSTALLENGENVNRCERDESNEAFAGGRSRPAVEIRRSWLPSHGWSPDE